MTSKQLPLSKNKSNQLDSNVDWLAWDAAGATVETRNRVARMRKED